MIPTAVARETVETVLAALADGSTREDVATRMGLSYWTVVRIAQGRIKGKTTWPADSAAAWEPTCMDADDWAAWQAMNRSLGKENQAPRPCTDCLAGYAAEMRAVGRCNGQPAGDHREEDIVDDRLAAIVVPDDVPGPPGTTRPMRIAWYLCHDLGLPWADAARVLGTSSWNVSQAVERFMLKAGLKGDPPGRLPAEERQRRAMVAKGLDPDHVGRRRAKGQTPEGATQVSPAAEVAPVAERLVLAPEGHPWATDPEPIEMVAAPVPVVDRRADHAETIPVGVTPSVARIARDLARMGYGPTESTGGEPEPVASPAKGTPSPHHPAPQVLEDPESTDQAPAAPEVDAAAAIARLARERDEMEMARDELRELLADARSDRERYLDALLAGLSTHPTDNIRDRIERALGITVDRDAWADGYRRALGDVLDIVRGTRGTTYPQVDIIEKVARLAIDVPAA